MKLIVGLGNPGSAYVGTRHNVGFEVIDLIAERMGWLPPGQYERLARSQFSALTFEAVLGTEKVMLMKPTTFMNESGRAVQAAAAFYKLDPVQDLLVILDDLALPCGRIRLKAGGSDGGHNGLRSINRSFGHTQYPRLRIGIDPVPGKMAGADYVLGKWTADQRERLDLGRAAGCVTAWVNDGVEKTANAFNVDPNAEPPKPTESAKPTEPKKQTEE